MNNFIIALAIITAFFIGAIAGGFCMFVFMSIISGANFFSDNSEDKYNEDVKRMRSKWDRHAL